MKPFGIGQNLPMYYVSWNDCQEFITKLRALTGKNFRMPTEAEWEFASRGGIKSRGYKYSGSNNISKVAWFCENSKEKVHPVGTKAPNELGIYDMSGNVYELCSDFYGDYPTVQQINPKGIAKEDCTDHVARGGSWYFYERRCCSSYRNMYDASDRIYDLGLRLAL